MPTGQRKHSHLHVVVQRQVGNGLHIGTSSTRIFAERRICAKAELGQGQQSLLPNSWRTQISTVFVQDLREYFTVLKALRHADDKSVVSG